MNGSTIITMRVAQLAATVGVGVMAGLLLMLGPMPALGVAVVLAAVVLGLAARREAVAVAVAMVAVGITGYTFLGKSFAYIGVGPVYVGELLLGACLLAAALPPASSAVLGPRPIVVRLYVAFAAWGAVLLAGDLGDWGIVAVRDAALWYYGLFMLAGATLFATVERIEGCMRWAARSLPWLLAWIPLDFFLTQVYGSHLPNLPGTDVSVLVFKGGDMAVMLAVVIVFLIACRRDDDRILAQRWPAWLLWSLAILDFVVIATKNRGGMLSIFAAVVVAVLLMPNLRILQGIGLATGMIAIFALANVQIQMDGRDVSVAQLGRNVLSIVGGSTAPRADGLQGTERWRKAFWSKIVDDTVHGERFWTGNGFGVNLADRYGFQVNSDDSLRSPHDATMTVLGRMGVPGAAMWLALQLAYGAMVLRSFLQARRIRDHFWCAVFVLLLAHWLASNIDASFDPYLEGPQGAIIFWTGLGLGVAAQRVFAARGQRLRPQPLPALSRHATTPGRFQLSRA